MIVDIGNNRATVHENGPLAVDFDASRRIITRPLHVANERVRNRTGRRALDFDTLREGAAAVVGAVDVAVRHVEGAAVEEHAATVEVADVEIVEVHRAGEGRCHVDGGMATIRTLIVAESLNLQVGQRDRAVSVDVDVVRARLSRSSVDGVQRFAVRVDRTCDCQRLVNCKPASIGQRHVVVREHRNRVARACSRHRLGQRLVLRRADLSDVELMDQLAVRNLPVGIGLFCRGIEDRDDRIVAIRSLILLRSRNRFSERRVLRRADLGNGFHVNVIPPVGISLRNIAFCKNCLNGTVARIGCECSGGHLSCRICDNINTRVGCPC